ncbi:MAG TPA: orotidine 5'-phosphate decarboxylase / HUMPS family protein [Candidatus Dormibacteraeota bacterium]|nr:orotidine 5'-phosphate decarboxylase / HUMPS family protein [Candidatus Dormibacteraeota bacterium]
MNWQQETIKSYDGSAQALSNYFQGIGSRTTDIELGLDLANASDGHARVVEIGCGDGRDATEIVKRVAWYEGFDPSKGMLDQARVGTPSAAIKDGADLLVIGRQITQAEDPAQAYEALVIEIEGAL